MSNGFRGGTHVAGVLEETTAFGVKEAGFDAGKKKLATWDVSPGFKRQTHENQSVRSDLGEHPVAWGVKHTDSELSFNAYLESLDSAAGDGVAAASNAFTFLLAMCLGGTIAVSTGSTVNGTPTPTTTAVTENDSGNHAANTLVPFTTSAGVEVVPISTYSSGAMTLLCALSAAPAADSVVYGASTIKTDNAANFIGQGEVIGRHATENYEFFGAVGNFSMPEVAANEPQTIAFTIKCATYDDNITETQAAPTVNRPTVSAGGKFQIGKYGNTAMTDLKFLNASIELGRTYTADPDTNTEMGICGHVVTDQQIRVTLHVHPNQTVPTGMSGSNWRALCDSETDNDFHILLSYGRKTAGDTVTFYLKRGHIVEEPELTDIDGIAALKLVIGARQGSGEDQLWVGQA